MKGYTIQNSIDLLEKKVEKGGGGTGGTASDVSYDNTGSGLTADNVQSAIDEIAARDASDISYDNTSSGLTADDVQEAIDELAAAVGAGVEYSTNEKVIGKWVDGSDLYQKIFVLTGTDVPATATNKSLEFGYDINVKLIDGHIHYTTTSDGLEDWPINSYYDSNLSCACRQTGAQRVQIYAKFPNRTCTLAEVIVTYTKPVVPNTRKKKS